MADGASTADWIRDPAWQFAGVTLALAATTVTWYLAWRRRKTKRLVYSLKSTELVSVNQQIGKDVRVYFGDTPVADVRMVEFRLRNAGTIPIEPGDFMQPLSLEFGESTRVLSMRVQDTEPDDLDPCLSLLEYVSGQKHGLVLDPLLLNPGDAVVVTALVSGSPRHQVKARISGVSRVEREAAKRQPTREMKVATVLAFYTGFFGAFVLVLGPNVFRWTAAVVLVAGLAVLGFFLRGESGQQTSA